MSIPADIKAGKLAPVYVLYGSELGPMRAVVEALREQLLDGGLAAFNHERFVGRELEGPGKVLEACMQVPMMASHRLVELDEPEAIGKGRGAANPKLLDPLIEYIGAPSPSTVLVITSTGIDARSRIVTAAKKRGVIEKFEGLRRADDAIAWVREHARELGIPLDAAGAEELVERCGNSPSALAVALEQASIYAGKDAKVGAAEVAAVVTDAREAVVFDLTDAVGMGKHEKALAVLRRMFAQGEGGMAEAGPLLAMLARQLRLLLVAHGAGLRASDFERAAGVPPFVARKLLDQARRFSEERLRRAFAALVRLDGDLKGGSFVVSKAAELGMERWILEACNALPGVARR
jgi:DNA polymerase-3 subunit delta